ncbi:MAG: bifunctional alpha,alpha-trehalose-phosphate synthase (UDP-forming)/trehalose-phosphatase [Proteobacteria bacterium]|nr:MAG: bifunctional alpha,alpha-trehalose-phosphate synthase (UDP-forming)/trehalose-phosphatase [Pseudomonadota bacterium]
MNKLLIISNRLPVTVKRNEEGFTIKESTGGLVTGLSSLLKTRETSWIGWHGLTDDLESKLEKQLTKALRERGMQSLSLSKDEVQGYYNDFSNGALWPLYHYQIEKMPLELLGWKDYESVNERFCEAVVKAYSPGDFIWIQDYHLQLLPSLIRARLPNARIGFFLHIPFPSSEIFRIFPWRRQILEGLLGADIIGFHTHSYARHFQSSLLRILGLDSHADSLNFDGRLIKIGVFPLGVDSKQTTLNSSTELSELASSLIRLRDSQRLKTILLSVDRLDYTKGLPRRLLAFEKLLELHPSLRGTVTLVQIAAPSRVDVSAYESYKAKVEGLVGRINGRFGLPGYQPIHYISRGFSQAEILSLYPLIDVMIVTPLRDGMNLVAKEFISARTDCDGVLVLSELAGAAEELGEAVQVNPYDLTDTAQGLYTAISMPHEERIARMTALRERVIRFDASEWARRFIFFLSEGVGETDTCNYTKPDIIFQEIPEHAKKIIFLDYDGTLFPIVKIPKLAAPDSALFALLERLSKLVNFEIHIVSGRPHHDLMEWFGKLPISLHAEHGAMSRNRETDKWTSAVNHNESKDSQSFVRSVLEKFTINTPGSFIEEKAHSIAWHYRMSDPVHGERMANELRLHARETFAPLGLELLAGKKMVEIRHIGINKGTVIRRVLEGVSSQTTVIAIGDDITDEDMFHAVPDTAITIAVGGSPTAAKHRLRDPSDVRLLLELLNIQADPLDEI